MTRTILNNTYSGTTRTATVEEVSTRSEDLSKLANLYAQLSNTEHRIESLSTLISPEGEFLLGERARLNTEIIEMKNIIKGYDNAAE